ncbi:hypothetical protein [Tateyamaria sp. ANG-S1]|uniref:hypothetical protein n=1 Tax=Tateyamaria sp. ANG-S1 TaxID=1577905 RepID=UPI000ABC7016|nr:hypothetical protein [Tateyamaria sp. ANG-S1]
MTRSTKTIPFHYLNFMDDITNLRDIEERWKKFLKHFRREAQDADLVAGKITEQDLVPPMICSTRLTAAESNAAPCAC